MVFAVVIIIIIFIITFMVVLSLIASLHFVKVILLFFFLMTITVCTGYDIAAFFSTGRGGERIKTRVGKMESLLGCKGIG